MNKDKSISNRNYKGVIILFYAVFVFQFLSCKSVEKTYSFKWFPKTYQDVVNNYEQYNKHNGCKQGETIASIGAGNGLKEVQISCVVDGIHWYLQEIDSSRLYQFTKVLAYHEKLKGAPIHGDFNLVVGTESNTMLSRGIFDRVLMMNVFHEIDSRERIMLDINKLLKNQGELVIMERMAKKEGEIHGDCKFPKLFEDSFLKEMDEHGFTFKKRIVAEEMSNLMFFTFESSM